METRLVRTSLVSVAVLLSACTPRQRFMYLEYERPAQYLRAAVTLAKVNDQDLSLSEPLRFWVDVRVPADSLVVAAIGEQMGPLTLMQSLSTVDGTTPQLVDVIDGGASALDSLRALCTPVESTACQQLCPPSQANCKWPQWKGLLLHLRPGLDTTLTVLGFTKADRKEHHDYRMKLRWISQPLNAALRKACVETTSGPGINRCVELVGSQVTAQAIERPTIHELDAGSTFMEVNWILAPLFGAFLIGVVFLAAAAP